ncbi:MAG: hypothetical protein A2176_03055 [Spirochaetes bacterium RBG_13_51_14]|nr:MAG: hypothetical protein A2176_03055 [Spirochaetes bacterium RBG_13_51_14]
MLKKIVLYTTLLMVLSSAASAKMQKEKILVCNLAITFEKSIIIDEEKKAEEEQYDYFSFIVPHALAQNLNASGMFEAQKIDRVLPIRNFGSDLFYSEVDELGKQYNTRYIITGRGTVRGRKLTVELALVDIRERNFWAITGESFETGAELKTIISDLTAEIERKIAPLRKQERKETKELTESPFMKAYRVMDDFSFGLKTGRFFIKGPFSRIYEDAEYLTPYLSYDILKWLGVSAEADYLAADNGAIIVRNHSSLSFWGVTLNAVFSYHVFQYFGVKLTAGCGASIGKIYLSSTDNPLSGLVKHKQSVDPYLTIAASFILLFRPLELQFGTGYKSAFFKGKSLSLLTVFFGIGYHL